MGFTLVREQKASSFLEKYWVSSIGVFVLSQLIFFASEATGWILKYRDMDGTIFERLLNSFIITEWFNFYETPQYNLMTVFFGIFFLVPGIISVIIKIFTRGK